MSNAFLLHIDDIVITPEFAKHKPNPAKIADCMHSWRLYEVQDRYVIVDENNVLLDGYTFYVVAKQLGITDIECKHPNKDWKEAMAEKEKEYQERYKKPTVYVFGVHAKAEGNGDKEYVWKIPKRYSYTDIDFMPNDKILVNTQWGKKAIIVTRIETLSEPPVEGKIRTVVMTKMPTRETVAS